MTEVASRLRETLAGRYDIERELGAGGMAVVYLATDVKHRRKVAVKVLRPELTQAVTRERFLREIDIVAGLHHPNILPLYDSGAEEDFCFFVMPWIEGDSLRAKLKREGQLPVDEAVRIASEVAEALVYAHSRGVIHRDIKPRNIMMQSGHALLTDFGIALVIDAATAERLTTGHSPGTPLYMSPEQAIGERRIDARTDIYSLGCVLYEMLAGDPPFTGSVMQAIMARKTFEPPPRLRVVRERIPEALEAVTLRALATVPADRYATAADLLQALREVANAPVPDAANNVPVASAGTAGAQASPAAAIPRPDQRLGGDQRRPGPVIGGMLATIGFVFLLFLTTGYLSAKAFDLKLQVPPTYARSFADILTVGFQSLVPVAIFGFVIVVAYLLARVLLRFLGRTAQTLPFVGATAGALGLRLSHAWSRVWRTLQPRTIAELFFLGGIVLSIGIHALYWPVVVPLFTSETATWACAYRVDHRALSLLQTLLIVGLSFGWFHLFRWLGRRTPVRELALPRWGSLALILALLVIHSVPWRLMWETANERVVVNGERGYILFERPDELLIYNADRRVTAAHSKDSGSDIERRHIAGYVFEEPAVFRSERAECSSVTDPGPRRAP